MSCVFCQSSNQREFPAEINIHFPGKEGIDKPTVWVFPRLLVCMDCGITQFEVQGSELQQLAEGDSGPRSQSMAA